MLESQHQEETTFASSPHPHELFAESLDFVVAIPVKDE
jgi:hypothetical protein